MIEQGADAAALIDRAPVNQTQILNNLRSLPISSWKTPGDETGARHLGPSGSDFRKAFGLGSSDESIAPNDLAAVGLVATKALAADMDQRLSSVDDRLKTVEADGPATGKTRALRRRVAKQAKRIRTLTRRQRATTKQLRRLSRQVRGLSKGGR